MRPRSSLSSGRLLSWPSRVPSPASLLWTSRIGSSSRAVAAAAAAKPPASIYGQRRSKVGAAGRAEACSEGQHQEATLHPSRQRQDASEGNSRQTVQGRAGTGQRSGRGSAVPTGRGGAATPGTVHERQSNSGSCAPAAAEGRNLERSTAVPGGRNADRQGQGGQGGGRGRGWSKRPDASTAAGTGAAEPGSSRRSITPPALQHAAGNVQGAASQQPASISASLLTSLLKRSLDAHSLMQLVERYEHCSSFDHIHAATALTYFAKLAQKQRLPKEQGRAWVARLVAIASSHLSAAGTRELVNMLHAVATLQSKTKLGPVDPAFAQQLMTVLQGRVPELNGQGLSNTLWALATLAVTGQQSFATQLVAAAQQKLPELTAQALSNSLWALATLYGSQHSHSHFIQAWVKEAEGRLSGFNTQELSNSLWALATLYGDQPSHSHFIQAWVREAVGRLSGFNEQNLSNSLWALSKLGHTDCSFTARLLQAARAQLQGFKPQDVSNTAFALATLRYQDTDFMRRLVQHARSRLPDFTSQAVANTLLAMAWLGYNDAAFVEDAVRHLLQHRGSFNAQELCNTLWALCILDHSPAAALQPLLAEASSTLLLPDTNAGQSDEQPELSKQHCQAYQYLVTMDGQGHISPQLKAQYRQLWEVCQAAWAERLQQGAHASFTQQQVLQAVRELPGCEGATCEQLSEDGLQSIDVALQLPDGRKVAVEVDGPMHFMANAPDVPDGSTLWRNRMLQLRGWQVVSVPAVQWSRVSSQAEKKRAYLLQRFAQAGVQLPGACIQTI